MFFSSKTITVEFGCNKADRPKMLAEPPADIVFDYTYMLCTYSQVWNKSAALLLNFETIFPNYTLISTYTFISFQENFLPTLLIAPTLLLNYIKS